MGTAIERQSALTEMSLRGLGVGMTHETVLGFDVEVVRDRVAAAREHALAGNGPVLLEFITYRYRGHSMSDPAKYRPKGELEEVKETRDPIDMVAHRLVAQRGVAQERLDAIKDEVEAICQDAVAFAEASPHPDESTLYDFVYAPQTTSLGVGPDAPTHTLEQSKAEAG
jgi:pyruvate dehydrogenase E1 component alpha subunit